MTVAELYEGALWANWGRRRWEILEVAIRRYLIVPFSAEICRRWGEVRYARRAQPISSEDAWIAATALAHRCDLVTHNANDFRDIPGLHIVTAQQATS
jgi:tRNA(fMet)-specific endonuclease VapC